ncbi:DNA cytosine methyltransferase [Cohnella sp. CFH 77786]|nr:DNA cytosine methyltransferase [Cohnella sp. CFH 77786]MBW5444743.1 DNA cytosine methyltransferase [Cohnella sp. CFH 77786]
MYRVLDVFAGAGGMSLGFVQTGSFEIGVAVEKNESAQATYLQNHGQTTMLSDILDITDYDLFQREHGNFDVIVGGPPCQGFSNANRQKNHIVSQNNSLVKKYVEVILNLRPKAFVMENVRMLRSDTHRFYCSLDDGFEFDRLGITKRDETICLLNTECPVADITDYVFNREVIEEIMLPDKHFYALRIFLKNTRDLTKREMTIREKGKQCIKIIAQMPARSLRVSKQFVALEQAALNAFIQLAGEETAFEQAEPLMTAYINIHRLLMHAKELLDNNIILEMGSLRSEPRGVFVDAKSYSVIDYISKRLGESYHICDDVLNAAWFGAPQLRERYIAVGLRSDLDIQSELPAAEFSADNYRTVYDAIKDLETVEPSYSIEDLEVPLSNDYQRTELTDELRNSGILRNHIATDTREVAKKRFEALGQGQNFHDLDRTLIEDTYTNPERTQNSIYLRLEYNKPSGTVTNVRKSMWIHPVLHRAISIREAARLQTFPDSFVFVGTKDSQYQQVGNAVPPIMAKAIACKLAQLLDAANQQHGGVMNGGFLDNRAAAEDDVQNTIQKHCSRNDCQEVLA